MHSLLMNSVKTSHKLACNALLKNLINMQIISLHIAHLHKTAI